MMVGVSFKCVSIWLETFMQDDATAKQGTSPHLPGVLDCLSTLWKQCSPAEAERFGHDIALALSRGIAPGRVT